MYFTLFPGTNQVTTPVVISVASDLDVARNFLSDMSAALEAQIPTYVTAQYTYSSPNLYHMVANSVGLQVEQWILVAIIAITIIFACFRLGGFILYYGVTFSIPQVSLALIILSCLIRVSHPSHIFPS